MFGFWITDNRHAPAQSSFFLNGLNNEDAILDGLFVLCRVERRCFSASFDLH